MPPPRLLSVNATVCVFVCVYVYVYVYVCVACVCVWESSHVNHTSNWYYRSRVTPWAALYVWVDENLLKDVN